MVRKLLLCLVVGLSFAAMSFMVVQQASAQGGAVLIQDAIARKLVNAKFTGTGDVFFREAAAYEIQNIGPADAVIVIPVGLYLTPTVSGIQQMIVGQAVTLTIKPNQMASGKLWVFCTQLSNHAPDSETEFELGSMASGNLLKVAQVIARHDWKGDIGAQLAVWRITDNMTQEKLTGDSKEASELIRAILPLLGLAGDPFTRAETILQEAGTGLHYSEFGTPVPAKSPLPGNTNVGDLLALLQRCFSCCPCFGAFGGMFFLWFVRR